MASRKSSTAARSATPRSHEIFQAAEETYAAAMKVYLVRRDWTGAAAAFREFLARFGPERDVAELADRARTHLAACERKLSPADHRPESAEEWLRHGVALANAGQLEGALAAFDEAERSGFDVGRVRYARSAALALEGQMDEALAQLKLAIELDPEHRAHSMGDPDFERLRESAGYVSLVEPPDLDDDDYEADEEFDDAKQERFDDGPQILPPDDLPPGPSVY